MGRINNTMALAKSSWAVLKADKQLAIIPVVSFFVCIGVVLLFGGAFYLSLGHQAAAPGTYRVTGDATTLSLTPVSYLVGALGYVAVWLVVTFFTAALVAGAHERLTGGEPTLGSAFGAAWLRFGELMGWSVLSGAVGLVIQQIERRGLIGAIVGRVAGIAWRLCTWLAIPVIVVEGLGPFKALQRSGQLFKRTWGENVIAQMGFGLIGFLLLLPGLVIGGVLVPVVPIAGAVIIGLWIGFTSAVMAALNGIFRTALYLYASNRPVHGFDQQALAEAFRPRTSLLR